MKGAKHEACHETSLRQEGGKGRQVSGGEPGRKNAKDAAGKPGGPVLRLLFYTLKCGYRWLVNPLQS